MGRFAGYLKVAGAFFVIVVVIAVMAFLYGQRRYKEGRAEGEAEERSRNDQAEVQRRVQEGDGPWLYRDLLKRAGERP
jgi:membrane protein implicated in regulation of membrane protease activity